MGSWTFGEAFVESYNQGLQLKQKKDQFAEQVRLDEEKMRAEDAFRTMQMDKLNRQIEIAEEERKANDKYRYDSLVNVRMAELEKNYISVKGDPAFDRAPKKSGLELAQQFDVVGKIDPEDERVPAKYFELVKQEEAWQARLETMTSKENAKEKQANSMYDKFLNALAALDNIKEPQKQIVTTQPAVEPGKIVKAFQGGNKEILYENPIMKSLLNVAKLFKTGSPAVTKEEYVKPDAPIDLLNQQAAALQNLQTIAATGSANTAQRMSLDAMLQPRVEEFGRKVEETFQGTGGLVDESKLSPSVLSLYRASRRTKGTIGDRDYQLKLALAKFNSMKAVDKEAAKAMLDELITTGALKQEEIALFQ